jgi:DNA polymerase III epsilon subunit-like protein
VQYVSIDLETTGLNPDKCQILEMAAVLADTTDQTLVEQLPTFHCYVLQMNDIRGEPGGLAMHAEILRRIAVREPGFLYVSWAGLANAFRAFLMTHGVEEPVYAAGKNFGAFDLQFLRRVGGFEGMFRHRYLDPAPYFFDFQRDEAIPDLQTCLVRADLPGEVSHTALEDARDVVRVLQVAYARRK